MDKKQFIEICDRNVKLIRAEYSYSQEKMSSILGLSKKTLVEIEKGRSSLGWTGSAALCAIFGGSEALNGAFEASGGKPADILLSIAFEGGGEARRKTTGSRIFWQNVRESEGYTIQLNAISQHYRLLDPGGKRIASSLDIDDLIDLFNKERKE
ncbi:MAG: transcriptional regulator [Oscillospiraceae bacterium]|nr:transcriptional regulator [Oscillospiraceae bacterium]